MSHCTPKMLYNYVRFSPPQPAPEYSIHLNAVTAATVQRSQCAHAHHTPAIGGEERESDRTNSMDGDY